MSGQVSVTVNSYRKLAFRPLVWFSSSQLNTVFIGLRNSQELVVSPFPFPAGSQQLALGISCSQGGKGSCQKT